MTMPDEPDRLLDPKGGGSPELRAALAAARDDLPSPEVLAELAIRLAPLASAAPAATGVLAGSTALGAKLVGAALVALALAGGGVWWAGTRQPDVAGASVRSEEAGTTVTEASGPQVEPAEVGRPLDTPTNDRMAAPDTRPLRSKSRSAPTPTVPTSEPEPEPQEAGPLAPEVQPAVATVDVLALELALIREAQGALASDPGRALGLADDHAVRFADGSLAQEREVVAIQALMKLGRSGEARARADQFAARWPTSAHLRRLEVVLGGR